MISDLTHALTYSMQQADIGGKQVSGGFLVSSLLAPDEEPNAMKRRQQIDITPGLAGVTDCTLRRSGE